MNPLSPFTYWHRHKRSTFLLMALVCLATIGLYVLVAVLDSIPMRAQFMDLTKLSRVYPATGHSLAPGVAAQIEIHPDVARVIPENGLFIAPPALLGSDSLRLMGVSRQDAQDLMAHCGVRLKEGRLFQPRTNEIVLSEEIARALGLEIGDTIDRSVNDEYYRRVLAPLTLVGTLESDSAVHPGPSVRVGFASYEYLEAHELYAPRPTGVLVVARQGRQETVEEYLETEIASVRTETDTFREEFRFIRMARQGVRLVFGVVNCLVAVVVALVVGVINRIALLRRTEENGLLHAVGYQKKRLVGRLTLETAAVTGVGWGLGIGFALLALYGIKMSVYYAKGAELSLANPIPLWFVAPIPLVVISFATLSVRRMFTRFDAVAIVERGKLSMEAKDGKRGAKGSSVKPLSSWTFYSRHRRRGIVLVASMALMILGVAFPIFLVSTVANAMEPAFEHLRAFSEVSPTTGDTVDPGVMAQIRSHPTVAHVIPALSLWMQVLIPPGSGTGMDIYGVSETNLPVLMDLLDVQLVEGRLPTPRTNEIAISRAVAMNRGLQVGDGIGRPVQEANGEDNPLIEDGIPTEMIIVGLLDGGDVWLGFASLEYLESHELTASHRPRMLIVPSEGRMAELEPWLEENVASTQTDVHTYRQELHDSRTLIRTMTVLFALIESLIALVAAIALATLNYIFYAQRKEEFGILHAIGRGRPWLILRTVKETGSTVGLAWLLGAVVCLLGLIGVQALIYTPRGLSLNLFDVTPWVFTLPIPLIVVLVGAGTIARTLGRLDPVAVIEHR